MNTITLEAAKIALAKRLISTSARLGIYKKMATFLQDGIPLDKIVALLSEQYLKQNKLDPRAIMLRSWQQALIDGRPLSAAMSAWAPATEAMLIQAGEASGDLSGAFFNAFSVTDATQRMRGAILASLAYPSALFVMLFGIMYAFSTRAIPKLAEAIDPSQWHGASQNLYSLSQFIEHKWWVVLLAIAVFVTFAAWSMKNLIGPFRSVLNRIPPWNIYRSFQSSVFLISASAMMKTGKPIFESILDLRKKSPPYVAEELRKILVSMEMARSIGESMNSGFLDKETGGDIEIYSKSSSVEQAMEATGRASIESSIKNINAISGIMNIVAMAMVAGFIGWVYYSFFTLTQQIGATV